MMLKKMHRYLPYSLTTSKKRSYGNSIIPLSDCVVPIEVLKNTGFEEISWSDKKPETEE
jgi:hypothetical protein